MASARETLATPEAPSSETKSETTAVLSETKRLVGLIENLATEGKAECIDIIKI